jgi:hypothetical protein
MRDGKDQNGYQRNNVWACTEVIYFRLALVNTSVTLQVPYGKKGVS